MKTKFGGGSRESYRALKFVAFQRVNLFAERAQKARASTRGERGHAVPENFWILHFSNRQKRTDVLSSVPVKEGILRL